MKGRAASCARETACFVYVRFERSAAAGLKALRAAGAKVISLNGSYRTVTVAAKPSQLRSLGSLLALPG